MTVLTDARKLGISLTIAHQSLSQLDESMVSLILGNTQIQVFFRVSRQDAELLSKEAMNIVDQLYERDTHLMQEPEQKFTLSEMWEVAFHNLSRLQAREAYVMVKGIMDHPERMRTLDNPTGPQMTFPFDESYLSLPDMKAKHAHVRQELEKRIESFNREEELDDTEAPDDLEFFDSE